MGRTYGMAEDVRGALLLKRDRLALQGTRIHAILEALTKNGGTMSIPELRERSGEIAGDIPEDMNSAIIVSQSSGYLTIDFTANTVSLVRVQMSEAKEN